MDSKDELVFKIEFFPVKPDGNWTEKQRAKWAVNRMYYSCNVLKGKTDVAHYIADQEKVAHPVKDLLREHAGRRLGMDFLSYRLPTQAEEQSIEDYLPQFNTLGVFGLNGALTKSEYQEWIMGAQKTNSSIWYGVISLPMWLSPYVGYEDMELLMRTLFSNFLRYSGFNTKNIALFGAMHDNTEHMHVHFAFYEKAPKHIDSNGKVDFLKKCVLPKSVINNFRLDATKYFSDNLRDLSNFRNAILKKLPNYVPTKKELYIDLIALDDKLPMIPYLRYNGDNVSSYRKDIDKMVQRLLRGSGREAMVAYNMMMSEIAERGKVFDDINNKKCFVKQLTDEYISRLGNVVLGMVRKFRSHPKLERWCNPKSSRQYKAQARCRREVGMEIIESTIKLLDSNAIQLSFMRKLNQLVSEKG